MIERKELSKIWKRTLLHFAFALLVGLGVITSLVMDKVKGSGGPSIGILVAIAAAFVVFSMVLFFAGRFIKNMIWRKFGEG